MLQLIKKSDPRIILFAAITLIAVSFSIFKAAGSLSGEVDSPGYRNQPPEAFSRPLPERIVDPAYLGSGARVSDQGYQFAYRSSQKISQRIIDGRISDRYLRSWGMSPASARSQARFLQGQYQAIKVNKDKIRLSGKPQFLAEGANAVNAQQIVAGGQYSSLLDYVIEFSNGQWRVKNISFKQE